MATTAAILKINFRHLFSNLRLLWAETCSLATGWHLDRNKLKLCWSKIQDGCNGSAPLNKMAARAKKIQNLQTTSRPWSLAWFQNICTEVFHQLPSTKITKKALLGWTKWQPELKIEALKDISSTASVLGPVVQSNVSLTSSLRVISLTVLADSIYNILIFFAEKMWVAFALQKLLTFFQQKISAYLRITRCKF